MILTPVHTRRTTREKGNANTRTQEKQNKPGPRKDGRNTQKDHTQNPASVHKVSPNPSHPDHSYRQICVGHSLLRQQLSLRSNNSWPHHTADTPPSHTACYHHSHSSNRCQHHARHDKPQAMGPPPLPAGVGVPIMFSTDRGSNPGNTSKSSMVASRPPRECSCC